MKKIIITLFAIFVINNSVLADGHVKRIISTSQTGMGKYSISFRQSKDNCF